MYAIKCTWQRTVGQSTRKSGQNSKLPGLWNSQSHKNHKSTGSSEKSDVFIFTEFGMTGISANLAVLNFGQSVGYSDPLCSGANIVFSYGYWATGGDREQAFVQSQGEA